jgi:CO/xanthine dehydrogenase Mo-binding subunit
VGGGFGSKAGVSMEALAVAIASHVHGRPVKLRLTREEEFYTAFVRQGLVAYFKMGCDKNGCLLAMENRYYWDGGRVHRVRRQHHACFRLQQYRPL